VKAISVLCLVTAAIISLVPSAGNDGQALAAQGQPEIPASAACMVLVQPDGQSVSIILPAMFVGQMSKRGYASADCSLAFGAFSRVEAWRDNVCDLASIRTEEVQLSYREKLGERPAVLCAYAEAVIGRWVPKNQRETG
jgi:hypothetical protein